MRYIYKMWKDKEVRRRKVNEMRHSRMKFLRDYKKDKCCAHCGWNEHPEILNFHHLDPSKKEFGFAGSAIGNLSLKRIMDEIDKCILLCPTCHQWLHYQETAI